MWGWRRALAWRTSGMGCDVPGQRRRAYKEPSGRNGSILRARPRWAGGARRAFRTSHVCATVAVNEGQLRRVIEKLEWHLDPTRAASSMREPRHLVDGRNALDPTSCREEGLLYASFGRGYGRKTPRARNGRGGFSRHPPLRAAPGGRLPRPLRGQPQHGREGEHRPSWGRSAPEEHSVREIAALVIELPGSRSEITYEPLPEDDPGRRCPDISRARGVLGWEPRIQLGEGLEKTLDWFVRSSL